YPGCASKTERAREETLSKTATFNSRLKALPALIDRTVHDAATAAAPKNTTRESDFRKFQASLAELRESAKLVGDKYVQAQSNSDAFFREWGQDARQLSGSERLALEEKIHQRI